MADKFHPSNVLNFSIQHEIILLVGGIVCISLTVYIIKKIYRDVTVGLLIDIRKLSFHIFIRKELPWSIIRGTLFLLLISWGILILILISASLEGIIILPASMGAFVSLAAFCRIKSYE